jgi:hypothetical protein
MTIPLSVESDCLKSCKVIHYNENDLPLKSLIVTGRSETSSNSFDFLGFRLAVNFLKIVCKKNRTLVPTTVVRSLLVGCFVIAKFYDDGLLLIVA